MNEHTPRAGQLEPQPRSTALLLVFSIFFLVFSRFFHWVGLRFLNWFFGFTGSLFMSFLEKKFKFEQFPNLIF
jgi:hypothetical protein